MFMRCTTRLIILALALCISSPSTAIAFQVNVSCNFVYIFLFFVLPNCPFKNICLLSLLSPFVPSPPVHLPVWHVDMAAFALINEMRP